MLVILWFPISFHKNKASYVLFLMKGCSLIWTSSWCPHTFESPQLWASSLTWVNPPPHPIVAQSISPPRRCRSMTFEKVRIVGFLTSGWYYIYNKYFVNKLTTLSLYKKSFINNNIVNKTKCIYWFNCKIVIGSQRTTTKC